MEGHETPLGVAIVVCERVITEAQTSNKTLVSTFNNIQAQAFPCRHERLSVYVALTNGQGVRQVKLRLKKVSEDATLFSLGGEVKFEDPNHVVELIFNLRNVVFADPGSYSFEVEVDLEYVFESRFNVSLVEQKTT